MKALDTVQRSVNITKTQICVDSVQDGEPSGFLYNPYMPERIAFWQAKKSDQRQPEKEVTQFMAEEALHSKNGEKATFTIQVQFRQNATWQGTIAWMENKKIQQFRSALEMIKLMDNALAESSGSDTVDWE